MRTNGQSEKYSLLPADSPRYANEAAKHLFAKPGYRNIQAPAHQESLTIFAHGHFGTEARNIGAKALAKPCLPIRIIADLIAHLKNLIGDIQLGQHERQWQRWTFTFGATMYFSVHRKAVQDTYGQSNGSGSMVTGSSFP